MSHRWEAGKKPASHIFSSHSVPFRGAAFLPFMYGGCLSSEDLAEQFFDSNLPDLAGTWAGPGEWFDPALLTSLHIGGFADGTLVKLQLTLDENGDIVDATVDDGVVPVGLFTGVTSTVSGFQPDLVEFNFSNNYTGGLISDFDSLKYVYFFSHDDFGDAFAHGVLEKGATGLPNAISTDFEGTWSGFGFDFDENTGTAERFALSNLSIVWGEGMNISGTDADGNPLNGFVYLRDGPRGHFDGTVYAGTTPDIIANTIYYGFMSPDKNVIGFMIWPDFPDYAGVWSVVLLTRQP